MWSIDETRALLSYTRLPSIILPTPGPLPTLPTDLDHGQTHNWMLSSTHTLPRHPQIPQTLTRLLPCAPPPQPHSFPTGARSTEPCPSYVPLSPPPAAQRETVSAHGECAESQTEDSARAPSCLLAAAAANAAEHYRLRYIEIHRMLQKICNFSIDNWSQNGKNF